VSGRLIGEVGSSIPPGLVAPLASTAVAYELALIGGGNMGAALLGGLMQGAVVAPEQVVVVELYAERRDALAEMFPGVAVVDGVPQCTAAVLSVKPPDIVGVAAEAAAAGATRVLSIAAGVTISAIESAAGEGVAVLRAMPNTPALVRQGVSALAAGRHASTQDLDWAERILAGVGLVVRLEEHHIDAVTGLTGSGPAYVFLVAEALMEAGVRAGIPSEMVEPMVVQLLLGSANLLAERGDPAALRAMVTSPGGTTAAGLSVLEERDTRGALIDAVVAATARSRELGSA
jgi:pyrroline-5-carboxylate reductase